MFNKQIMLIVIFFVGLLAVSTANAADNITYYDVSTSNDVDENDFIQNNAENTINDDEKTPVNVQVNDTVSSPSTSFKVPIKITNGDGEGIKGVNVKTNLIDSHYGEYDESMGIYHDVNVTSSYKSDDDGAIFMEIDPLRLSGTYLLTVSVIDDVFKSDDVSANVVIKKQPVNLTCTVENDIVGKYLDIYLKDIQGNPLKSLAIFVQLDNKTTFRVYTNLTGHAKVYLSKNNDVVLEEDEYSTVIYTKNLSFEKHVFLLKFRGNSIYEVATKTFEIDLTEIPDSGNSTSSVSNSTTSNVNNQVSQNPIKAPVKTTLTLKKVTVKRSAKKLTIQATLKVNGKGVKNKIIKFKFNKKTYKARTNAKGVAKITVKKSVLKKLKKGKKVTYTATYGKITKKVTVKVKK